MLIENLNQTKYFWGDMLARLSIIVTASVCLTLFRFIELVSPAPDYQNLQLPDATLSTVFFVPCIYATKLIKIW